MDLETWLIDRIAHLAHLAPDDIDPDRSLESFGLSSVEAVTLAADLEDLTGIELPATLAWEHPTIAAIAAHIASLRPS